jgi:hypothetical protein
MADPLPKLRKRRVNPSTYNALLDRCQKAEARLREMKLKPAPIEIAPTTPRRPPEPYALRFPLDRDLWVSVTSNRPLEPCHWDRFFAVLAIQRETLCAPEGCGTLIPEDAGILGDIAA